MLEYLYNVIWSEALNKRKITGAGETKFEVTVNWAQRWHVTVCDIGGRGIGWQWDQGADISESVNMSSRVFSEHDPRLKPDSQGSRVSIQTEFDKIKDAQNYFWVRL